MACSHPRTRSRATARAGSTAAAARPPTTYLWTDEHWRLWTFDKPTGLPLIVLLESREHYDSRETLTDELAAELGVR